MSFGKTACYPLFPRKEVHCTIQGHWGSPGVGQQAGRCTHPSKPPNFLPVRMLPCELIMSFHPNVLTCGTLQTMGRLPLPGLVSLWRANGLPAGTPFICKSACPATTPPRLFCSKPVFPHPHHPRAGAGHPETASSPQSLLKAPRPATPTSAYRSCPFLP